MTEEEVASLAGSDTDDSGVLRARRVSSPTSAATVANVDSIVSRADDASGDCVIVVNVVVTVVWPPTVVTEMATEVPPGRVELQERFVKAPDVVVI